MCAYTYTLIIDARLNDFAGNRKNNFIFLKQFQNLRFVITWDCIDLSLNLLQIRQGHIVFAIIFTIHAKLLDVRGTITPSCLIGFGLYQEHGSWKSFDFHF